MILTPKAKSLRLRIGHPDGTSENIALESAKITIGTAPGCNLRLDTPGMRPVHCMILRGAAGTVVRGWSGTVLLNGAAVEHSQVDAGDRLQIGSVTLTILDSEENAKRGPKGRSKRASTSIQTPVRESERIRFLRRARLRLRRKLRDARKNQRLLVRRWKLERERFQAQLQGEHGRYAALEQKTLAWHDALETQHIALRQEFTALHQRQFELTETVSATDHLHRLRQDLESARTTWDQERRSHEEGVKTRRRVRLRRLRRATLELRKQLHALATQSAELKLDRATWDSNKAAWEQELVSERLQLQAERARSGIELAKVASDLADLQTARANLEGESERLATVDRELAQRRAELDAMFTQCAAQRQQLEFERAQLTHDTGSAEPQQALNTTQAELAETQQRLAELEGLSLHVDQLLRQAAENDAQWRASMQEQSATWEQERRNWATERVNWDSQHDAWLAERYQWEQERSTWQQQLEAAQLKLAESVCEAPSFAPMETSFREDVPAAELRRDDSEWLAREQSWQDERNLLLERESVLRTELEHLRIDLSNLQTLLSAAQNDTESRARQSEAYASQLDQALVDAQTRGEQLQLQLAATQAEIENLQTQLQAAFEAAEQVALVPQEELHREFTAQLDFCFASSIWSQKPNLEAFFMSLRNVL